VQGGLRAGVLAEGDTRVQLQRPVDDKYPTQSDRGEGCTVTSPGAKEKDGGAFIGLEEEPSINIATTAGASWCVRVLEGGSKGELIYSFADTELGMASGKSIPRGKKGGSICSHEHSTFAESAEPSKRA